MSAHGMSEAGGLREAVEALADECEALWAHINSIRAEYERKAHNPSSRFVRAVDVLDALPVRPAPEADPTAGERACAACDGSCGVCPYVRPTPATPDPTTGEREGCGADGCEDHREDGHHYGPGFEPATPDAGDASERACGPCRRGQAHLCDGNEYVRCDNASTSASEPLSENERESLPFGPDFYPAVERIIAAREARARAEADHWRGRFERMRLMYRKRFNEGLSTAEWHSKYCAAAAGIERARAEAREQALREAADLLHKEARWQTEQALREPPRTHRRVAAQTVADRMSMHEEILRDRAARIAREVTS